MNDDHHLTYTTSFSGESNIALSSAGSTCTCSTVHGSGYQCGYAIDGSLNTAWASLAQGVGAWIHIVFPHLYILTSTRIHQRASLIEHFKDIEITFGNDVKLQVYSLQCNT